MKKFFAIALMTGVAALGAASADARQGCGAGGHRGPRGACRANYRPGVAPVRLVIGNFYGGRGYWDGRRYWGHRYHAHGGWRYR